VASISTGYRFQPVNSLSSALRGDAFLQQVTQAGGSDGFTRQARLQLLIEPRHMDAARLWIGKIHRQIDAGGDLQLPAGAVRHAYRQGDALHAYPIQCSRQRHGMIGDIGKIGTWQDGA
jgi:hypothetical protein